MTEDQIEKLATLTVSMKHITETVDEIKRRVSVMPTRDDLKEFVTRSQLDSSVATLSQRVAVLEEKVVDQSPKAWMTRIREASLTVAAFAAAVGVVVAIVHTWDRIPGGK